MTRICSKPFVGVDIHYSQGHRRPPLALLAEGILDASEDEIVRVAIASGVDIAARGEGARDDRERAAAAQNQERTSFAIGETVALRSDPRRVCVVTSMTPSNRETRYGVSSMGEWRRCTPAS